MGVFIIVVVIIFVIILRITRLDILIVQFLELQSLACKPADSMWDQFLLDVFSDRVVQLQTFLNVIFSINTLPF